MVYYIQVMDILHAAVWHLNVYVTIEYIGYPYSYKV